MDKCILPYSSALHLLRSDINEYPAFENWSNLFILEIDNILLKKEIELLRNYCNLLFGNYINNNRKKLALEHNRTAAENICKRYCLNKIKYEGVILELDYVCEEIEIVEWQANKDLPSFNQITKNLYANNPMIFTYVITLTKNNSSTKITNLKTDKIENIKLNPIRTLLFHNCEFDLREVMSNENKISIFLHTKYKTKPSDFTK